MTELDLIKQAFEEWAIFNEPENSGDYSRKVADLFWPFIEMYFKRASDPKEGVTYLEMKELYKLKEKLGMELKAHEV